jgi:hypothetical protein
MTAKTHRVLTDTDMAKKLNEYLTVRQTLNIIDEMPANDRESLPAMVAFIYRKGRKDEQRSR